ncbi:hypothetical protein EST38_g8348 [Candolleomyces aberdarensis]|uniref:Uncharacterized protein n=1 Tax=Candolleomyces aberdarensis TaxID=2316362 RepID=A0A4Q2DEV0_9AGAR|nr:hypothetical protein EST38_g8348 [Candolleomyces aberdarensis]
MNLSNAPYQYMYLFPSTAPPGAHTNQDVYNVSTQVTQEQIVRMVNASADLGMDVILPRLPSLITPFSAVYRTEAGRDTVAYAHNRAQVSFLWTCTGSYVGSGQIPGARYALIFHIACERPYHSVCLAYTLARFSEVYGPCNSRLHLNLLSLCYVFMDDGVYGVLFYDRSMRRAYRWVQRQARRNMPNFGTFLGCPVSQWGPTDWAIEGGYERVLAHISDLVL